MLAQNIVVHALLVNVTNGRQQHIHYEVTTVNAVPAQFPLDTAQGTFSWLTLPEAFVGSQGGPYDLNTVQWRIVQPDAGSQTFVSLSGTVSYVTVEYPTTIITTQTIEFQYLYQYGQVPVNGIMNFQGAAPNLSLQANLDVGPQPGVNYAPHADSIVAIGPLVFTEGKMKYPHRPLNFPAKRA